MLNNLEQKYQQLITAKKWEGVGHIGETLTQNSSFNAAVEQEGMEQSYAANVKSKSHLQFEEWAKTQICHHCGKRGHFVNILLLQPKPSPINADWNPLLGRRG